MKKVIVKAKLVFDHFHDGDILYSDGEHSSFDIGDIMMANFGYDNVDEYNECLTIIYNDMVFDWSSFSEEVLFF